MSWKTVKNLLILLLVGVNVFLAVLAYRYYTSSRFTDASTAENAAAVLEKSGISVDSAMLAVRNDSKNTLYTSYNRESYVCLAASVLLGKEADGIYMLPNGVRAETLEGDSVLLGYDMSVKYVKRGSEHIADAFANAAAADAEKAKTACSALEKILSLPDNYLNASDCTESGDCIFITVKQSENSVMLYGMECVFGVCGEKILFADGKYFFGVPSGEESAQLLSRVNILFSEKERKMKGKVESIELCYTLYEEEDNGRMLYIPSYVVTYADGTVSAVNAISKNLY